MCNHKNQLERGKHMKSRAFTANEAEGLIAMQHFQGYFVNGDGWLFKYRNHRITPLKPSMKFPHGKYPYYIISINKKKYIIFQSELVKYGYLAEGKEAV